MTIGPGKCLSSAERERKDKKEKRGRRQKEKN